MYEWIGKLTQNDRKAERWSSWIGRLPRRLVLAVLAGFGLIIHTVARGHRETVRANMQEILTEHSLKEIRRLTRKYYVNLAVTLFELLLDRIRLNRQGEELIRLEGEANLQEALSEGRGAILYASHLGNFFYYYWRLSQKYDCLAVATATSPELRPIYLQFEKMGCNGLDYDETPPLEMMRTLRNHLASGGLVFLLGDFHRPSFPATTLFGKTTRAPAGAAALALDHKIPVVPCCGFRERGFTHRIVFGKPIRLYETYTKKQRAEAMLALGACLEEQIRSAPDQWFYWFNANERWEREEPQVPASSFPAAAQSAPADSATRIAGHV